MNKNEKYIKALQKVAHDHFEMVESQMLSFRMAKLAARGFKGKVKINQNQWETLGKLPAERTGCEYMIDLSDESIRNLLWCKSCYDAIQLGLYASTDISDSINMINNDNLDGILTDREAMIAVSQVVISGIDGFKRMKAHVDVEMSNI